MQRKGTLAANKHKRNWVAGTIIILVWLLVIYIALRFLWGIADAMTEAK